MHENIDTRLAALEERVEELIFICEQLALENQSLHARQFTLLEERDELIEKNERAQARIDAMVTRLKGLDLPL